MGLLISQTLSDVQFHNFIVFNAKIIISKHIKQILEIFIENIKYFPPPHLFLVKDRLFLKRPKKLSMKIVYPGGITPSKRLV